VGGGAGDGAVTVGLVCGDPVWEHAISWLLRSSGIEVVARARDVDRALDLVARSAPRVLIVDADGDLEPVRLLKRIRDIRHAQPATAVVVLCSPGDTACHDAALVGGAVSVVCRERAFELLQALSRAAENGTADDEARPNLTLRELEILRLVADGRTNREVARAAWVTEQTVKYHLANIYRRLGVRNRGEAIAWAVEHGVAEDRAAAVG